MPDFMDSTAFNVRAFENNYMFGWLLPPEKTSFGWVSVQLRTAARTLGLDPSTMSQDQFRELSLCLERDSYNIDLAARHLRQLADHDGYQTVGLEEVRVIGARYNRGMDISMQAVMRDTSYACCVFLMAVFMCFLGRSYDWVLEEDHTAPPIHDSSGDDRLLIGGMFLAAALICQLLAAFLIKREGKRIAALLSGGP